MEVYKVKVNCALFMQVGALGMLCGHDRDSELKSRRKVVSGWSRRKIWTIPYPGLMDDNYCQVHHHAMCREIFLQLIE